MTPQNETYFTDKNGYEVRISGDTQAIYVIERILRSVGIKWNKEVGTWDQGFYKKK